MFQRKHYQVIKKRIEEEPRRFIQVIYGPRQVGKTTLVKQFVGETKIPTHLVSADAILISQNEWLVQQWETARIQLKTSGAKELVLIIDEIQKIQNWAEYVKREWDYDKSNGIQIKVILLGSSTLMIQQGLTESLAGRFESTYMGHWAFNEVQNAFGLDGTQYVWFGGYPGAIELIKDEERWKKYICDSIIETSISKDILMLTRIDKPALMRRLFEIGCNYSGQILSMTKILGQLQDAGNTVTLSNYLNLLDEAGLLKGLEKFSPEMIRQRASSPKFMVHNTALMSAQHQMNFDDVMKDPRIWGRWVESSVGAHLVNYSLVHDFKVFYWRQKNSEVDFVLQFKNKTVALEVKSGNKDRKTSLSEFRKLYNPDKIYLIDKTGIPWEELLKINPLELF